MKNVQVHYLESDGRKGVINYLTAANTGLAEATGDRQNPARERLLADALNIAFGWAKVFPETQFFVKEV